MRRPAIDNCDRSFNRRAIAIVTLLLALVLLPAGCTDQSTPADAGGDKVAQRIAERGPVRFTVRARPGEASVGDPIELLIEAVAESGVEVEMPRLEDMTGPFEVVDRRTPPDVPDGDKRRWSHKYILSTFDSGELEIPSLTLRFTDRRATSADDETEGEPVASELSSEPLPVVINSTLPAGYDPNEFRDIRGVVEVPLDRSLTYLWIIAGAMIVIGFSLLAVLLLLKRRKASEEAAGIELPAHVWALGELDGLAGEALMERGLVKEYYFRLSSVVRQYIERRFMLMAPERTTDEFLREAQRSGALKEDHKQMLAGFLRAADMVKFALHLPPMEEGSAAMDAARSFVEQTAASGERLPASAASDEVNNAEGAA